MSSLAGEEEVVTVFSGGNAARARVMVDDVLLMQLYPSVQLIQCEKPTDRRGLQYMHRSCDYQEESLLRATTCNKKQSEASSSAVAEFSLLCRLISIPCRKIE